MQTDQTPAESQRFHAVQAVQVLSSMSRSFLWSSLSIVATMLSCTVSLQAFHLGLNKVELVSEEEKIAGALYLPPDGRHSDRPPAVIVEGPWTHVKEQIGAAYGSALIEEGRAAFAFDHRYFGERGGDPRQFLVQAFPRSSRVAKEFQRSVKP